MAEENKTNYFALIAIVAIVAIVGLVVMFKGAGKSTQSGILTTSEQGINLGGGAMSSGGAGMPCGGDSDGDCSDKSQGDVCFNYHTGSDYYIFTCQGTWEGGSYPKCHCGFAFRA